MEIKVLWSPVEAAYIYSIYVDGVEYSGDRKWAEKTAEHYKLKVPDEPES